MKKQALSFDLSQEEICLFEINTNLNLISTQEDL